MICVTEKHHESPRSGSAVPAEIPAKYFECETHVVLLSRGWLWIGCGRGGSSFTLI